MPYKFKIDPRNQSNSGNHYNNGAPYANDRRQFNTGLQVAKKRSGCKIKRNYTTKKGVTKTVVIFGWKYTKRDGLISFVASDAAQKYQKNDKYVAMVVKLKSNFGERLIWAHWNIQKEVLFMGDLKMVADPAKNYWSYLTKK